jgi:hypothetical protein
MDSLFLNFNCLWHNCDTVQNDNYIYDISANQDINKICALLFVSVVCACMFVVVPIHFPCVHTLMTLLHLLNQLPPAVLYEKSDEKMRRCLFVCVCMCICLHMVPLHTSSSHH